MGIKRKARPLSGGKDEAKAAADISPDRVADGAFDFTNIQFVVLDSNCGNGCILKRSKCVFILLFLFNTVSSSVEAIVTFPLCLRNELNSKRL